MQTPAGRFLAPDTPLQFIRGVGEARAKLFHAAGFQRAGDLLYFFPFRYEDRRRVSRIAELTSLETPVTLRGRVISAQLKLSPVRRLQIFEAILDDGSGRVMLVWFNQPWLAEQIRRDDRLVVYGQPRLTARHRLQFDNPAFERLSADGEGEEEGTIVPIYSAISGIGPKSVRSIVARALEAVVSLEDPLPQPLRERLGVIGLADAIVALHRPVELDADFVAGRSPAHRRVILEEFFAFQLALRIRRASEEKPKPRHIRIDDAVRRRVREILPFSLTAAQKKVLKEIAADMQSDRPMYRLLQGDVGSGKTIVALIVAIMAIQNGYQVALLAPTEILVEQHYQRIRQLLADLPDSHRTDSSLTPSRPASLRMTPPAIRVAKLTANISASERRNLLGELREGSIDLIVGTHALLEDRVVFHALGLTIVDEQHRFGVEQRQRLFAKAALPDILVMTATPIPRSLALAMYGDLELSVIDELPPGRLPVKTVVRGAAQLPKVLRFMDEQLACGAQAYVVYPIIEESEKLDITPLTAGFESFRSAFPARRVAMLHGRMPSEEKEATMRRFQNGQTDILVSTTVIEVGIDVPNASMMVVMDADRFGFSQLHQLRGRIGRGSRKSYCVLLRGEGANEEVKERLRLFESSRDGFDVAQRDLEIRGAGDFLGTRQSGIPRFRFGDVLRDHLLMETAREAAIETVRARGTAVAQQLLDRLTAEQTGRNTGRD